MSETDDLYSTYVVVVNAEEQYSIWPVERELPLGWRSVGVEGSKAECLAHIEKVWTDLRPLSVRERAQSQSLKPKEAS
jgi:MbtH protein